MPADCSMPCANSPKEHCLAQLLLAAAARKPRPLLRRKGRSYRIMIIRSHAPLRFRLPGIQPDARAGLAGEPGDSQPFNPGMRWIVAQEGSRESYAVPAAFHRLGMLRLFCADIWC